MKIKLITLLLQCIGVACTDASSYASSARGAAADSNGVCDRRNAGTSFGVQDDVLNGNCKFIMLHQLFESLLDSTDGGNGKVLLEDEEPIFHEGPVLFPDTAELYFTTNRLGDTSKGPVWGATAESQLGQFIEIYKLDLSSADNLTSNDLTKITTNPPILMANGMTKSEGEKYGDDSILATSQGFGNEGGGVYLVDRATLKATSIVDNYYGIPFNSLNCVKTTMDGKYLFLTDPVYGFEQGFREGVPQLGGNVYRYDVDAKELQVLSTALNRPNGVALFEHPSKDGSGSGGGCTLFLTDSGFMADAQTPRGFASWGDSAIYYMRSEQSCFDPPSGPFPLQPLTIVATNGIHDGIHVHAPTETLWYCDNDGAWVWSIPLLKPLGIINTNTANYGSGANAGCTQLIFDYQSNGVNPVYILAETKLLTVNMNFNQEVLSTVQAGNKVRLSQYNQGSAKGRTNSAYQATTTMFVMLAGFIVIWFGM